MDAQSIEEIYNYKKACDHIITGGQPSEEQLRAVADAGFEVIINLSTNAPHYALPDEEGLVRTLGLQYHYLPVQWETPTAVDFENFIELMEKLTDKKVLVHCAANYRASSFYALYALQKRQWSEPQADAFIVDVWQPDEYPQWLIFIDLIKRRIAAKNNQGNL